MRKSVAAICGGVTKRLAWLSFQPDGAISFGLRDRAFVPKRLRVSQGIWNAYNRKRARFEIGIDSAASDTVMNPHFTFHPPGLLHLKGNEDRSTLGEDIFRAVARVEVAVDQDGELPWIRAVTAPLRSLPAQGSRTDGIMEDEWTLMIPTRECSVCIAIDFIRPTAVGQMDHESCWSVAWGVVALRVKAAFTFPQEATLSWVHDA